MTPAMSTALLVLALLAYGGATGLYVAHLLSRQPRLAQLGAWALVVGVVVHVVGKVVRVVDRGAVPVKDGTEALGAVALVVAVLVVWAARRYRAPALGAFGTPLVFVTLAASLAFAGGDGAVPEALRSAWSPVHIGFAVAANACFATAGAAAAAFLVVEGRLKQKRVAGVLRLLPPLHVLEEIGHRFAMTGFLLLSVAMVAGSFFAKQMWGAWWSWDPKQCFTLVTWLFFAGILHARVTLGWRGRRAAWMTVTAVVLVLVAMVGLNLVFRTRHGGAFDGEKNVPQYLKPRASDGVDGAR
jgi:cytochrome c-type biogenesis protein CcsB